MQRPFLFSVILLISTFCLIAQAQKTDPRPEKVPCPNESKITRGKSGEPDKSEAWTTETSSQDGVLSLTYCGVFKRGETTINRIPQKQLTEMPAGFENHLRYAELVKERIRIRELPVGFKVYKDMAFEIRTEAVPNMMYLTFRMPSVQSAYEFKKLRILYLDEDEMLPGALSWHYYYIELAMPEPDLKARTFSAVFDYASVFHHATNVGRVVVGWVDEAEYNRAPVDLGISSVVGPPVVKVGETFSYSVTLTNSGGVPRPATDVVFNSVFGGGDFRFVSASSTQGACRKSVNSDDVVVCDLGTVDAGKRVVVTISVKAMDSPMIDSRGEIVFSTINMLDSRETDYNQENNYYRSLSTIVRR